MEMAGVVLAWLSDPDDPSGTYGGGFYRLPFAWKGCSCMRPREYRCGYHLHLGKVGNYQLPSRRRLKEMKGRSSRSRLESGDVVSRVLANTDTNTTRLRNKERAPV